MFELKSLSSDLPKTVLNMALNMVLAVKTRRPSVVHAPCSVDSGRGRGASSSP